ncbi:hypothetical protein Bhyg_10395, partial [Pseudolycoriella hygida]
MMSDFQQFTVMFTSGGYFSQQFSVVLDPRDSVPRSKWNLLENKTDKLSATLKAP